MAAVPAAPAFNGAAGYFDNRWINWINIPDNTPTGPIIARLDAAIAGLRKGGGNQWTIYLVNTLRHSETDGARLIPFSFLRDITQIAPIYVVRDIIRTRLRVIRRFLNACPNNAVAPGQYGPNNATTRVQFDDWLGEQTSIFLYDTNVANAIPLSPGYPGTANINDFQWPANFWSNGPDFTQPGFQAGNCLILHREFEARGNQNFRTAYDVTVTRDNAGALVAHGAAVPAGGHQEVISVQQSGSGLTLGAATHHGDRVSMAFSEIKEWRYFAAEIVNACKTFAATVSALNNFAVPWNRLLNTVLLAAAEAARLIGNKRPETLIDKLFKDGANTARTVEVVSSTLKMPENLVNNIFKCAFTKAKTMMGAEWVKAKNGSKRRCAQGLKRTAQEVYVLSVDENAIEMDAVRVILAPDNSIDVLASVEHHNNQNDPNYAPPGNLVGAEFPANKTIQQSPIIYRTAYMHATFYSNAVDELTDMIEKWNDAQGDEEQLEGLKTGKQIPSIAAQASGRVQAHDVRKRMTAAEESRKIGFGFLQSDADKFGIQLAGLTLAERITAMKMAAGYTGRANNVDVSIANWALGSDVDSLHLYMQQLIVENARNAGEQPNTTLELQARVNTVLGVQVDDRRLMDFILLGDKNHLNEITNRNQLSRTKRMVGVLEIAMCNRTDTANIAADMNQVFAQAAANPGGGAAPVMLTNASYIKYVHLFQGIAPSATPLVDQGAAATDL